ncbi:hypothetical protein T03_12607 [Trichinella britovi]|uniref:Uncharacterized protein n=1 Tax=Trichinella britovi TaxID=45882 RepID=A0A0V1D3P4_TRIBR|nr:hypothetical protein T03_12607 [Trichinella britovi]
MSNRNVHFPVTMQNEQHLHEYNIGKKIFVKIEFVVFLIVKIRKRVESINRQQWTSHRDAACFKNQAQQAEVQFCSRLNLLAALAVLSKCKEIDESTVLLSLHHAESCCLV